MSAPLARGERLALALLGAGIAWLVLSDHSAPAPGAPGRPPAGAPPTTPPEPLPSTPHDTWEPSPGAQAVIDANPSIAYVGGGPFSAARCVSTFTPHASQLAAIIRASFPWVRTIGGPRGRCTPMVRPPGPDQMNIHAVGRALDVMTPLPYGSTQGEQLANWAVANAVPLGIQLVIWNRRIWQGSAGSTRFAPYVHGTNPTTEHRDHVHIEVLS